MSRFLVNNFCSYARYEAESVFTSVDSFVIHIESSPKSKISVQYPTLKQYCHYQSISSQKTLKQVVENWAIKVMYVQL